ncbi:MAG: hypothetical protein WEC54_08720, partial [Gemmatimonadales bacterium]
TAKSAAAVLSVAQAAGVAALELGVVGAPNGRFRLALVEGPLDLPIVKLRAGYFDALPRRLERPMEAAS